MLVLPRRWPLPPPLYVAQKMSNGEVLLDAEKAELDRDADMLQLAGMEEHVVAEIMWQSFRQTVFTFGGRQAKLKEYLPVSGWSHMYVYTCTLSCCHQG